VNNGITGYRSGTQGTYSVLLLATQRKITILNYSQSICIKIQKNKFDSRVQGEHSDSAGVNGFGTDQECHLSSQ
jgi:hypothetical protein